jgi:uncharacterized protein YegL
MLKRVVLEFLTALMLTLLLFNLAVAQSDKKIAYTILIDNTGSLRTQFPEVVLLSKGIVEQIHQRGHVSLFNFQTQGAKPNQVAVITPGIEWSQDKNVLDDYIDSLSIVPGQTTLMDAINSMAEQLHKKVNLERATFGDQVIFLITDGEDRVSKIKEKQLIKALKENGIKVYAVGLVNELDNEGIIRQAPREKAVAFLQKITKETGGRAVFPKSTKSDVGKLLSELFTK